MQVSRFVKIAYKDYSFLWNKLSKSLFSDFFFQIPQNLFSNLINEEGANIFLQFIEEKSELHQYASFDSDPYLRPYLYLLIYKINSSNDVTPSILTSIHRWIDEILMINSNWCLIILQEESSFFGSNKTISKSLFVENHLYEQNIIIIQCKRKNQLNEQSIEILKAKIRDLIFLSFQKYEEESKNKFLFYEKNSESFIRYKIWYSNLLLYFGLTYSALNFFLESYELLIKDIYEFNNFYLPFIDIKNIIEHPLYIKETSNNLILFSLTGAMCCYFIKTKFLEIIKLFFKHFNKISDLCDNRIKFNLVEEWAENQILKFLNIKDFLFNTEIGFILYEKLFYLQLNRNAKELNNTYQILMLQNSTGHFYRKIAISTRFIKWANLHNYPFPEINEIVIGWKFGLKNILIKFENSIQNNNINEIKNFSKLLICDKSNYDEKFNILKQLSNLNEEIELINPFKFNYNIISKKFGGKIQQYKKILINFKFNFPKWLNNNEFDNCEFIFKLENSNIIYKKIINNFKLNEKNEFIIYFKEIGKWKLNNINFKKNLLILNWFIEKDNLFLNFEIIPLKFPDIKINFPILTGIMKIMKLELIFNFLKILEKNIFIELTFLNEELKILDQNGYDNEKKIKFNYNSLTKKLIFNEGNLTLNELLINFQLEFLLLSFINLSNLEITLIIDELKFKNIYPIKFQFPIEIFIRSKTELFFHLCLKNISNYNLFLESIEIPPDNWKNLKLNSNEELFLICKNDSTYINLFISEQFGSSIAQSYNLKNLINYPIINIEILENNFIIGESFLINLNLPINCNFYFKLNKNFFISGLLKKINFLGGKLILELIPLKNGYLKLPKLFINNIKFNLNPFYIFVNFKNNFLKIIIN